MHFKGEGAVGECRQNLVRGVIDASVPRSFGQACVVELRDTIHDIKE